MANLGDMMAETANEMGGRALSMRSDDVECAETDGATLFYSHGFMSSLENAAGSDGVRFVVAHELGHQVAGMEIGGHAGEFMADEFAARALARSGGDFSAIASVFSFLPDSGGSESHPSNGSRIARAREAFVNARAENCEYRETAKPVANRDHEHDLAI